MNDLERSLEELGVQSIDYESDGMSPVASRYHTDNEEDVRKEISKLKIQVEDSSQVSYLLKQSERDFLQQLVESNIRAATLASLWCLKAHCIKKQAAAFHHWKIVSAMVRLETQTHLQLNQVRTHFQNEELLVAVSPEQHPQKTALRLAQQHLLAGPVVVDATGNPTSNNNTLLNGSGKKATNPQNQVAFTPINSMAVENAKSTMSRLKDSNNIQQHTALGDKLGMPTSQQQLNQLSHVLLDEDIDAETKRQILLSLSHDIMQRGKSSSSQSTSGSPAKNQFAFDPLLMSPIMKVEELDALSKRSSLDALRAQGEYHPYYQPNTSNISPSRDVKKTLRSTSPSHNANASRRSTSPLSTRSASSPRPVGFGTSASRGHLFNEESFSLVKFRHGEVGDYIKHLMNQGSNNSEGSRSGSRSSSRDRARGPSRSNPSYGNISSSSSPQNNTNNNIGEWYNIYGSDIPQSQPVNSRSHSASRSGKLISPNDKPRYLMPTNASRKKVNVAKPAVEINVPINASRSSTPNTSASRRPTTPSSAPTSSRNISPFYNSHQRTAQSASTTFTHAAPSSARRLHVNEQQQVNQHSAKKNTPNHLVQNRSDSPSILSLLPKSPNPLVSANRNKQARKSIGSEADGEVEEVEHTKPDSSSHIQQNGIQNNNKNHHQNRLYYMSESPNYLDEGEIDFTLDKSVEGEGDDNRSVSSLGGLSAYSRISHASSHSKNNPAQETAKKGPNSLSSRSKPMNGKEKETNKPKSKSNYQQKSLVDHYKTRKSAPSSSNNSISSNGPEAYKHLDSVDLENHMMLEQLVAKKITSDSTKSPPAQTSDVSEASHEHKEPTEETNQHTSETDPKNAHSPPTIDPQSPPITNSKGKTPSSPSSHYVNPLYQHHSTPPPPPHEAKTISLAKEQPPSTVVDDNIYNYSYLYEDVPKKTSTSASKTKKPTSMEKAQLRLLKGEFEDNYGKTRGAWQTSLRR